MSGRSVVFHCPFCGEGDLWPHEPADGSAGHGAWECRGCLRAFSVRSLGLVRPEVGAGSGRPAGRPPEGPAGGPS